MKQLQALQHVIGLRERERDLLGAQLADQQAQTRRCQSSLERVQALAAEGSAAPHAALALNGGAYRESLLRVAEAQRDELLRLQTVEAQARGALHAVARRHESLNQVADGLRARLQRAEGQRTRRLEDELAGQAWQRGRA